MRLSLRLRLSSGVEGGCVEEVSSGGANGFDSAAPTWCTPDCKRTAAVTGVAAIDLFSEKRWSATPVHRIVRRFPV